jgi:hypothetical protein
LPLAIIGGAFGGAFVGAVVVARIALTGGQNEREEHGSNKQKRKNARVSLFHDFTLYNLF